MHGSSTSVKNAVETSITAEAITKTWTNSVLWNPHSPKYTTCCIGRHSNRITWR